MNNTISTIDTRDRVITFMGKVDEDNIKAAIEKINALNISDEEWFENFQAMLPTAKCERNEVIPPIRIILSTFGGSVYDGLALFDTIKNSKTPIVVECMGKIMSMGIIILLAASQRKAHKHTTFMIHSVSSSTWGQLKDLEDNVDEAKRLNDMLFGIITDNTIITKDKLDDVYEHKKDWILSADEAFEFGLVKDLI